MKKYIDELALWIGLITGVLSLLAYLKDDIKPIAIILLIFFSLMCIVFACVLKSFEKKKFPSEIDGIHVNALDIIDQTFISNPHLALNNVNIRVSVVGRDVRYTYIYSGKVIGQLTNDMQGVFFNSAGEANDIEDPQVFYGYDLNEDPNRERPIKLTLLSPPGMAKKWFLPFQKSLKKSNTYSVEIHGVANNIFPLKGTTYYFVRFAYGRKIFSKNKINYTFDICFKDAPNWIRKNEITSYKSLRKLGSLNKKQSEQGEAVFTDIQDNVHPSTLFVYTFDR